MRSDWVKPQLMDAVLLALTPQNRLVMRVCLSTGLRVGDVVTLRAADVDRQRFTIKEQKTGKSRRVRLPRDLWLQLQRNRGAEWVFEGRCDRHKHRTRQAVWKDVKRAARAFRLTMNCTPHSARKVFAVDVYSRTWDLDAVRRQLNHDDFSTTLVYVMAASREAGALPAWASGGLRGSD